MLTVVSIAHYVPREGGSRSTGRRIPTTVGTGGIGSGDAHHGEHRALRTARERISLDRSTHSDHRRALPSAAGTGGIRDEAVDLVPRSGYRLHMIPREAFLEELKTRTSRHLEALAEESGEVLGRFLSLPELGPTIYRRLVEDFNMDGAQQIGASLVDLFSGGLDAGTVMLTDREYRGLRLVLDEFNADLPQGPRASLEDLIATLSRADRR